MRGTLPFASHRYSWRESTSARLNDADSNIPWTIGLISPLCACGYLQGLMLGGTLPGCKWIACPWFLARGIPLGISPNTLELLSITFWRSTGAEGLDVWTSSGHNRTITPRCPPFSNFFMLLDSITLEGIPWIPLSSFSFQVPRRISRKIPWKWITIAPNDCNHWIPDTTSAPTIWIAIAGISNKYSPIVRLMLWHFLEQFMVPPSAIVTWNSGVRYMKQFEALANLQLMRLYGYCCNQWTLPHFSFLIYPSILGVWGVAMSVNAWNYMVGVFSFGSRPCDGSISRSSSSSRFM
jgi:hypothetical protein